ncbi:MAG: aminopeptidase P family N-terminal domain-containing protein, partial [Candidatus Undinarchaeales archaeon]
MFGKKQTDKLMQKLKENDLDCLLLINLDLPQLDPNFYYFTGMDGYEHSIVLLSEEPAVYVPGFETARAEKESSIKNVNKTKKGLTKELGKILKGKKVGINGDFMPFNFYKKLKKKGIEMTDFSKEIKKLRVIKNKKEIEYIRKATKVSKDVLKDVDTGKSEIEIASELMYKYFQNGMKPGYDPIVAFDADSTVPHFVPTNAKAGKSLLIDSGAAFKNYTA